MEKVRKYFLPFFAMLLISRVALADEWDIALFYWGFILIYIFMVFFSLVFAISIISLKNKELRGIKLLVRMGIVSLIIVLAETALAIAIFSILTRG